MSKTGIRILIFAFLFGLNFSSIVTCYAVSGNNECSRIESSDDIHNIIDDYSQIPVDAIFDSEVPFHKCSAENIQPYCIPQCRSSSRRCRLAEVFLCNRAEADSLLVVGEAYCFQNFRTRQTDNDCCMPAVCVRWQLAKGNNMQSEYEPRPIKNKL